MSKMLMFQNLLEELINYEPDGFSKAQIVYRLCLSRGHHKIAARILTKYGPFERPRSDMAVASAYALLSQKQNPK